MVFARATTNLRRAHFPLPPYTLLSLARISVLPRRSSPMLSIQPPLIRSRRVYAEAVHPKFSFSTVAPAPASRQPHPPSTLTVRSPPTPGHEGCRRSAQKLFASKRESLWRSRNMAVEAVDAVQELKLAAVLDASDEQRRWEEEEDGEGDEDEDTEPVRRIDREATLPKQNSRESVLHVDLIAAHGEGSDAGGDASLTNAFSAGVYIAVSGESSGSRSAGTEVRWRCGARVEAVMRSKVARLVKPDMLLALQELQRQQQWRLAARVFEQVRREHWYKPDPDLCARMINCLGLAGRISDAQSLFHSTHEADGVPPCSPTFTALLAAHCRSGDHRSGREVLRRMREAGAGPYDLAYMILIKTCEAQGDKEAAEELKRERDGVLAKWAELGMPKLPRRSKKK